MMIKKQFPKAKDLYLDERLIYLLLSFKRKISNMWPRFNFNDFLQQNNKSEQSKQEKNISLKEMRTKIKHDIR